MVHLRNRRTNAATAARSEFGKAVRLSTKRKFRLVQSQPTPIIVKRPPSEKLTSLLNKVTRLPLPHGCFNAGIAEYPGNRYVCVYRPNEYRFCVCLLNSDLTMESQGVDLGIDNCADPRLLWLPDGKLLLVYSSYDHTGFKNECIRGAVLADISKSYDFVDKLEPFRISPPGQTRQKNWMPFLYDGQCYLTASVKPHIIYKLSTIGEIAEQVAETDFISPWFNNEFLRGNTNAVQLDDGNYLGTFHSVVRSGHQHIYDNGCYVFEGKPPFKVLRCSNRTYLPAEAAIEPHFRKAGVITVCFPVGMVRSGDRLLISYGDNDSSVKIMETTVSDMLSTTLFVY